MALAMLTVPVHADPVTCMQQGAGNGAYLSMPACVPPDSPPTDFEASFDADVEVLTLVWSEPDSPSRPDAYEVYRDGSLLATTTSLTIDDDLSTFEGTHSYYVRGVWGTDAGDASLPIHVTRSVLPTVGGGSCSVASIGLDTAFPFVAYSIHDECLPP